MTSTTRTIPSCQGIRERSEQHSSPNCFVLWATAPIMQPWHRQTIILLKARLRPPSTGGKQGLFELDPHSAFRGSNTLTLVFSFLPAYMAMSAF